MIKLFDCIFSQVIKLYKESIDTTADLLSLTFIGNLIFDTTKKAQGTGTTM